MNSNAGDGPAPTRPTPVEVGAAQVPDLPDGPSPLPAIVAIAGPSCSGKTELAHRLCGLFETRRPVLFPLDGYYRDLSRLPPGEIRRHNFDSPDALDVALLREHLCALARGRTVERPAYDYASHRRMGWERIQPGGLLLVEGLFALYWEDLLPLYALSIYVDLDDDTCLRRRLARDLAERGASTEFTRWQWKTHVKPMADAHVRPFRSRAGMVLDGSAPPGEIATTAARRILPLLPPSPPI